MNRLIHYKHSPELEEEDENHNVPIYSIDIYDVTYLISVGHERQLSAKKNVFYFPVYLLQNENNEIFVYKQIGAYEFESDEKEQTKRLQRFKDKDGDIDVSRLGDLLLYSFADRDFFKSCTLQLTQGDIVILENDYFDKHHREPSETEMAGKTQEKDPEDPFHLEIPIHQFSKSFVESVGVLKDGVFEQDIAIHSPPSLMEESREDAENLKKEFKLSKNNKWIENFMKNNHYDMISTASNGDCFFDAIRQAYLQQGMRTTVEKLRALISTEATEETLQSYKRIFNEMETTREEIRYEMEQLKREIAGLKRRMDVVGKKRAIDGKGSEADQEQKLIQIRTKEISDRNAELKELYALDKPLYDEFAFMKEIESVEDLRKFMKTTAYWADEWTLSTIERKLSIKCMVFAEDNYKEGDFNWILKTMDPKKDRVFQCTSGEVNQPKHYILLNYTGRHYELISYKQKYMFDFSEMPYDVKIMAVIKCMESKSSVYNKIQSFRNFQSKLGISVSDLKDENDVVEEEIQREREMETSYDPDVVLMYYSKSANTVAPGKGNGESITPEKAPQYKELGLKKYNGWRRMLDDHWLAEFTLDGHKWYTVEHYYQASKFRKMHPEFYKTFSLDQGSEEISKDVEMARVAGSKTGAKGKTQVRPANIKIDPDFYGGRYVEEREKALYCKFTQNADLKKILLLTQRSKLVKYVPKKEPEPDVLLMRTREKIKGEFIPVKI